MEARSIAGVLRNRTFWGVAVGGVVAVAAFGFFTATGAQGAEQPTVYRSTGAAAVRTSLVSEGPLTSALAYTGDVKAVSQVTVLPKASGRIERLTVDVGSSVKKGDVIAELEAGTLRAQVRQAKANVAAASAKYASMESGSREEQIAQAKANLDSAAQRLSAMEQGSRDEQLTQAQAGLDAAMAKASSVRKGATDADRQAAQSAADAAKANLDVAKARLETVKIGATDADRQAARSALDAAKANLLAAQSRLADLKAGPKPADIAAAQSAVDQAKSAMAGAEDRWQYAQDNNDTASLGAVGLSSAGQGQKSYEASKAAYDAAVERLNQLRSGATAADLQAAQSAADAAKANYDSAAARVEQIRRGATAQELQQAEGAVTAAEASLVSAQARLKQVLEGATVEDLQQVDAAVAQAQAAYDLAAKPFRAEEIAQARNAVLVAQQQYQLVLNPYTKNDLDLARASVDQAKAALEMAEIVSSETVVVSPTDGIVSERFLSAGALVSPAAPIVSLIGDGTELVLGVEESQIGLLRQGQRAEITVAAYPGETFPATVAIIAPSADPKSRTFAVKVRPEDASGRLKPGMFAQVRVVTGEKAKAVLVPKEAVVTRGGQTVLFVVQADTVQMRPVKVGVSSGASVEIVSGLSAGEEVVTAGLGDLKDGDKISKPAA